VQAPTHYETGATVTTMMTVKGFGFRVSAPNGMLFLLREHEKHFTTMPSREVLKPRVSAEASFFDCSRCERTRSWREYCFKVRDVQNARSLISPFCSILAGLAKRAEM
jgi:hypothetical protein